jgi:hypothetical protein
MAKKRTLHGSVKKLIKPLDPSQPEKVEIDIHEADDLYREIRIENVVTDGDGGKDKLKLPSRPAACTQYARRS